MTATLIRPAMADLGLRPVEAADAAFLRTLFASVRSAQFAAADLPATLIAALLEQQFEAQARGYAVQFPAAESLVIEQAGRPVGRLIVARASRSWRVVDIALLPSARCAGIGTAVLEAVVAAARAGGASMLALTVLATNVAARQLYARLGFTETGEGTDAVHIPMERQLAE